jgi:hypothetical protein
MPERTVGRWRYLDGARLSWRVCGHLCEAGHMDWTGAGAYGVERARGTEQQDVELPEGVP